MITMYTKEGCPYCVQAKKVLEQRQITFEQIDLSNDDERQRFYKAHADLNIKTVPQIFINNLHVGGYTDLVKYLESQENTPIEFNESF